MYRYLCKRKLVILKIPVRMKKKLIQMVWMTYKNPILILVTIILEVEILNYNYISYQICKYLLS